VDSTVTGKSTVGGNSAVGGGIYNDGLMTLSGSTVSGNTGACIFNDNLGNLTIQSQSSVVNNTGFIENYGEMTFSGSTVSGNSASLNGACIYNAGVMTLSGSTVSGNSGGGIYNQKDAYLTIESQSSVVDNTGYNLFNNHGHVKISHSVVGK
jgi:hypothetical protein